MNKRNKANALLGAAFGVSIGASLIGWEGKDLATVIGAASGALYMGLIYWNGGRITAGSMFLGVTLFAFSAFIVATMYLIPGQEEGRLVMGSLAFLLSLVPYWLGKRAIRAGKIADGKLIN